jgi:DNA-binding LacI/PurR family transcriptional regulator
MSRVTLQTIADRLGVSRMTVSNAFSRPDQLSAELRERILAAAQELGYVGPDPAARALARGTTGAVGVLLTDSPQNAFGDEVATSFLGAMAAELAPTGLALTLLTEGRGDVVPARDVAIDGALVYSCRVESPGRTWLLRRKLPLVYVDQDPVAGIPSVNVDDRGGARAAAQHLLDLGHRRIAAIVLGVDGTRGLLDDPLAAVTGHPQRQRLLGWFDALEPVGVRPVTYQVGTDADDDADEAARVLLGATPRPTAVLCFSDVIGIGVIRVAGELGVAIPGDLSVVGFDDSPAARRSRPQLTTVHQDVDAKGRAAIEALTAVIAQARAGRKTRARHVVLPTTLVVRASTAPPPADASPGMP